MLHFFPNWDLLKSSKRSQSRKPKCEVCLKAACSNVQEMFQEQQALAEQALSGLPHAEDKNEWTQSGIWAACDVVIGGCVWH